jgi:phage/plasmid-associated DNA primase
MATYKQDDIIPVSQLGINMDDPFEVYSWAPLLSGDPEEAKAIAIYNMAMKAYEPRQNSQGLNNLTTAGIVNAVMPAITEYFPDPLSFENKSKALELYRDLIIQIVNYYVHDTNSKRGGAGKKKLEMINQLNFDMLVEIIFGYHEVVNFVPTEMDKLTGILMAISKDEEHNPDAVLVDMKNVIADYMVMMSTEKYTKENLKKLDFRIKSDYRARLYITNPTYEQGPKYAAEAIPFANGVYIRPLYEDMGRLLTYREAYKEYDLFFPSHCAARYLGPVNPVPVMEDGTRPDEWLRQFYASTPERERQLWGVILAVLLANDAGYDKGIFLMDDGLGSTGKSTFIKFLCYMIGMANCAKLSLAQIALKDGGFTLSVLRDLRIKIIFADENEPNDFYDKMSNLKELITGDPITISAKYENDVSLIFHGRIIQSINNGMIKSSDNGGSLYRRILAMKCKHKVDPGDGSSSVPNNKRIKKEYVMRQDWIDWLATEAVNRNIDELIETDETKTIKTAMEERNNKVLRFFNTRVNSMQQNWFRLDYLWPAFQVFLADEKFNDKMTYTTFEDEAKKIIARRDSQWTYMPESEAKSDVPKNKNVNGITVPLTFSYNSTKHTDEHLYDLKYDMIYAALMEVTRPGSRYADYASKAREALDKMYRSHVQGPGTIRGVYYRKDAAELEMLKYLAEGVVAEHREEVSESDIYKAMSEHKAIAGAGDVNDLSFGTGPVKFEKITNSNVITLIDFITKRFKKLHYQPGVM